VIRWLGGVFVAALGLGCLSGDVVRVVDGVEVRGRFVSDWAYASYTRGAEWEARARYREALRAYRHAVEEDPGSVEVWTRIGALHCLLDEPEPAREAFAEAQDIDARYEPLWRMRAVCAERESRDSAALAAARLAVELDPSRDLTVLLYVRLLVAAGEVDEAWRWLRSLSVRSRDSLEVWQAIEQHAAGRDGWMREARRRIAALRALLGTPPDEMRRQPIGETWKAVDAALRAGDLAIARRQLRAAHHDVRMLAARAIVVGKPKLALEEASLRLAADPDDSDARITVALAADLAGERSALHAALVETPVSGDVVSEVAALLMAELLLRHSGQDAARAWLGDDVKVDVNSLRMRARQILEREP